MKNRFGLLLVLAMLTGNIRGQNTLFDDTSVSAIHITLPADSLDLLYDSILSDHYYMARFIFEHDGNRDTLENAGFRLRGNTSRFSQKKSFKVSFNEYVAGREYQGVKKINLNGEHNDPALIREKLFYDLWEKAGMTERRTSFTRVYINGAYYGLYTCLEELDKNWLSRNYSDNGGNLFKCTYPADLVYHGPDQQTYRDLENETVTGGRVYELQTNKTEDDYTGLVDLITILNRSVSGTFANDIALVFNVDRFLKALALDVATGNWDDYGYNKNNYYLYENPANQKFDFFTYDPDNIAGIDWFGIDWGTRDCRKWINTKTSLPLAQKLLSIPDYFNRYKQYLDTIARTIIEPDSIFPRIDAMHQLVRQAAVEDTFRTLDYGYTVADFDNAFTKPIDDHTPYGLKPFFTTRQQTILAQLHPAGIDGDGTTIHSLTLWPNPVSDILYVSLPTTDRQPVACSIFTIDGKDIPCPDEPLTGGVLNVKNLAPGLFFLRITTAGTVYQGCFIKK